MVCQQYGCRPTPSARDAERSGCSAHTWVSMQGMGCPPGSRSSMTRCAIHVCLCQASAFRAENAGWQKRPEPAKQTERMIEVGLPVRARSSKGSCFSVQDHCLSLDGSSDPPLRATCLHKGGIRGIMFVPSTIEDSACSVCKHRDIFPGFSMIRRRYLDDDLYMKW